ncbi:MAG: tRNA (adenosine(37)-N6)-threonylcarbamoyltransferase complex transferase subunit TsaD [Candidatus Paceibacterota bacterium]|jgi:N6-L-threonylcarbamoyladenine synthase
MKILSIETSCDETGISVLEIKGGKKPVFEILANSLNSQIKIHAPFGGVFPMLAKREHIKNLPILLERTLKKAKLNKPDPIRSKDPLRALATSNGINLIAVTSGPGLEPALWTGIVFAKELSKKWNVPVIPINHMEGHILSVFGKNKGKFQIPKINFPILSLLVSGGHTELVLSKDWMKYKIIGETLDDAAGEAFDKVARMLELPYPGGPEISRLAEQERKTKKIPNFSLPRPMIYTKNFDFSFSGLKTAVLYLIRKIGKLDDKIKKEIACEFENAVVETLVHKTKKAIEKYNIKTVIVAGGVSSNKHLRKEIKKMIGSNQTLIFPEKNLSTDNSIMIGIVGYFKFLAKNGKIPKSPKIKADGNLRF